MAHKVQLPKTGWVEFDLSSFLYNSVSVPYYGRVGKFVIAVAIRRSGRRKFSYAVIYDVSAGAGVVKRFRDVASACAYLYGFASSFGDEAKYVLEELSRFF